MSFIALPLGLWRLEVIRELVGELEGPSLALGLAVPRVGASPAEPVGAIGVAHEHDQVEHAPGQ